VSSRSHSLSYELRIIPSQSQLRTPNHSLTVSATNSRIIPSQSQLRTPNHSLTVSATSSESFPHSPQNWCAYLWHIVSQLRTCNFLWNSDLHESFIGPDLRYTIWLPVFIMNAHSRQRAGGSVQETACRRERAGESVQGTMYRRQRIVDGRTWYYPVTHMDSQTRTLYQQCV